MSTTDPGWRPDPYGRADDRYFDGTRFTDRIQSDGVESLDPLGATATIPFTNPTGISTAPRVATLRRTGLAGAFDAVRARIKRLFRRS